MRNFIELNGHSGERTLVNVIAIARVIESSDTTFIFTIDGERISTEMRYEEVKRLIDRALR